MVSTTISKQILMLRMTSVLTINLSEDELDPLVLYVEKKNKPEENMKWLTEIIAKRDWESLPTLAKSTPPLTEKFVREKEPA